MKKRTKSASKNKNGRFKLGRRAFARISAVEGIELTPEMDEEFREFDRQKLSASARRRAILGKYGASR